MSSSKTKANFLSLPIELRLCIYDHLLVYELPIKPALGCYGCPSLSVLRTCKQINAEASPILYSQNTFKFHQPIFALSRLLSIGAGNAKHLHTLIICRGHPDYATRSSCGQRHVLDQFLWEGTGLRDVFVYWDPEDSCPYGVEMDLLFVRDSGEMRGLVYTLVTGYHARPWPGYWAKMICVPVRGEICPPAVMDFSEADQWIMEVLSP